MKTRTTLSIGTIPQGRDAALRRPDGAARRPCQKARCALFFLAAFLAAPILAQETSPKRLAPSPAPAGDYATDLATVGDSQQEAIELANQLLEEAQDPATRSALKTAIEQMEAAGKLLEAAKKNPADLPAAAMAEQSAFQTLLKLVPNEHRVTRSRRANQASQAGQPGQRQLEQLDMKSDENLYETERQAAAPQTAQQREQLEAADRLKQLAQRQQDLNDRLRELQTALQQARTEKEQEEIKRELKHLADEERQMLSDVDDLRQKLDQAPSSSSLSQTARDLDKAREETQRAAQELANQSVSQALASGTRAQQNLQNLRENLRGQTSSQFTSQLRQLQQQARELAQKEEDLGRGLEGLDDADHKVLDDSQQRQQLVQQMAKQQGALTNLLGDMKDLTEKSETTEPLLYEQLYDTLRRADQMRTESFLDASSQLLDRGFLTKAAEVERSARTNINELRQRIDRAAESVLGSQAQSLRYAQAELNELAKQAQRDLAHAATNSAASSGLGTNSGALAQARTNSSSRSGRPGDANSPSGAGTNSASSREEANRSGQQAGGAGEQSPQSVEARLRARREAERLNGGGEPANPNGEQANGNGEQANRNGEQASRNGEQAKGKGEQAGRNSEQGNPNGEQGNRNGGGGTDRLRELVQQSGAGGGARGGADLAGPILGNNFVDWADRMRDVEQAVDSVGLRNRLAAVRERAAGYRANYRLHGLMPTIDDLQAQVVQPLIQIRTEIQEELARLENSRSLVPLDHDPVPDNYSELVRKYYEKLGGGQ
jgi:hypothetical protein